MKTKLFYLGVIALVLGACSSARMQTGLSYNDDIYYNPKGQLLSIDKQQVPVLANQAVRAEDQKVYQQKVQQYSRTSQAYDSRDFSQIQSQYANILANEQVGNVDTVVYYNDQTGYWVNDFNGSSYDQSYAERIAKFHGPLRGIPYYSPLYTQVVYFSDPNWNVYVDGNYAYVFPSWSNRYYSNFYYGGYSSYSRWGFGMGFGWDYGWPYYGWNSYYGYGWPGYGYPYYGSPYYGWGGYYGWNHHHGHYYNGWGGHNYWGHKPSRPGGFIDGKPSGPSKYYGPRSGNGSNAVGNKGTTTPNAYRSNDKNYYATPQQNNRNVSVTTNGETKQVRGNVTYTRPSGTVNSGNKNVGSTQQPVRGNGTVQQNATPVRGNNNNRGGTTITNRHQGEGNVSTPPQSSGSSNRPSYSPSNNNRSTTIERSSGSNNNNSGATYSTPSRSNGSGGSNTYTPTRSGSSSGSGRTNRR